MLKIKICGITNRADGLRAVELGADALGFNFAPSLRQVSCESVEEILEVIPPLVGRVGVFVNARTARVTEIGRRCHLDAYQFHGEETPAYCRRFPRCVVIKAVRVKGKETIESLGRYQAGAYLLDSYSPGKRGGTGKSFPWSLGALAKKWEVPIILSGGLDPGNVARAIEEVQPYGIDVSSGVERSPGKKDWKKMAKFIRTARAAAGEI